MRMTRKQVKDLRPVINKMVQKGHTYSDISEMLNLGSHQLVMYHFKKYREQLSKEKANKI